VIEHRVLDGQSFKSPACVRMPKFRKPRKLYDSEKLWQDVIMHYYLIESICYAPLI
jgi:hypothetical protein